VTSPVKIWLERDGALLRLRLDRPKANIIDAEMIGALDNALHEHLGNTGIAAVLLDAAGPHFSFGASVEEHLPDQCAEMLKSLHGLIKRILHCPVPFLVAISGQCLGGGLEVAAAGQILFAKPDSNLGQPEMMLGVFAPAASCLLPERIGQPAAEDLLYSGRNISGEDALKIGLVDILAEDPQAAALEYFDTHLANKSASSIRFAVKAARGNFVRHLDTRLDEVEQIYLEELMSTRDAVEGLEAFIAKRPARWENK
jgi:cyclohexa-1,5-dienecarbonyl-CoA hydratase